MKKWLLVIAVAFGLLIPTAAFAAVPTGQNYSTFSTLVSGSSSWVHAYRESNSTEFLFFVTGGSSKDAWYFTNNNLHYVNNGSSSSTMHVYYFNGTNWVSSSSTSLSVSSDTPELGITSSSDIYSSSQDVLNGSPTTTSVFFHPPAVPMASLAGVGEVPPAILGVLITGGLIGTGLVILAIMLVVSLVPRLRSWFLR